MLEGSEICRILVEQFRKCGEKTEIDRPDPVLAFRVGFVAEIGLCSRFPIFPALPKSTLKPRVPKRETAGYLFLPK
ncbi:MAG: hypothetical protein ACLS3M_11015 [Collinsella sp.]